MCGGGIPVVSDAWDAVSDLGSGLEDVVRDIGSGAEDVVRDVGSSVDDFVNDTIPGGWTTVALLTAGAYYAPEIGAWMSADGETLATAEEVAAADAATASAGSTGTGLAATGGEGLVGGTTANLGSMGGAQGLTGAATSGATIGEAGGTLASGGVGSGIGSTIGSGTGTAATGVTLKNVADAARIGTLVNAIAGDPLGLGGETGGDAGGVSGFGQVGIPVEWKSPTYTYSPVQNITFEDLFPGVSLQGTQWQGLQGAQPNMTFNDMFAAGQQQTPMGTPVDINQIVGSILGQNAKS
jgi:hypothetical protein